MAIGGRSTESKNPAILHPDCNENRDNETAVSEVSIIDNGLAVVIDCRTELGATIGDGVDFAGADRQSGPLQGKLGLLDAT